MHNPHKGVHHSYGMAWVDPLETNDHLLLAKRMTVFVSLICIGFMGASSLVIWDIIPKVFQ